jgi:hypothetical protein
MEKAVQTSNKPSAAKPQPTGPRHSCRFTHDCHARAESGLNLKPAVELNREIRKPRESKGLVDRYPSRTASPERCAGQDPQVCPFVYLAYFAVPTAFSRLIASLPLSISR